MKSIELGTDPTKRGQGGSGYYLQTRRSGDVEVVFQGKPKGDSLMIENVALIPANRRAEIAEFLLKAV